MPYFHFPIEIQGFSRDLPDLRDCSPQGQAPVPVRLDHNHGNGQTRYGRPRGTAPPKPLRSSSRFPQGRTPAPARVFSPSSTGMTVSNLDVRQPLPLKGLLKNPAWEPCRQKVCRDRPLCLSARIATTGMDKPDTGGHGGPPHRSLFVHHTDSHRGAPPPTPVRIKMLGFRRLQFRLIVFSMKD